MTLPVPVFPETNLLNTRRTHGGVLRLSPNPVVNQITRFALGYAAKKHDITLYAHCSLSNHLHTAFHDRRGNHPEFRRDLHSLIARAVNRHRRTREALWTPDHSSPVILLDKEALLDGNTYVLSNVCTHDVVDSPEQWPGVMSAIEDLAGPPRVVKRPDGFFDPFGEVPEWMLLRFEKPREFDDWSDDEYRSEIARRVEAKCSAARERRRRANRTVVGRTRVLSQSPEERSKSQPRPNTLNPRLACSIRALRIAFLLWLKQFRKHYKRAREAFELGEWQVEFPSGTYLLLRRYGVNCSSVGPPRAAVDQSV